MDAVSKVEAFPMLTSTRVVLHEAETAISDYCVLPTSAKRHTPLEGQDARGIGSRTTIGAYATHASNLIGPSRQFDSHRAGIFIVCMLRWHPPHFVRGAWVVHVGYADKYSKIFLLQCPANDALKLFPE